MRITTNSVMNNYIYNLNTIMRDRDSAGNQTMTHRKFTKASQDPRSAQTASLLHRRYLQNKDYISTVKAHQERLDMVSSALEDIQGQGSKVLKDSALKAINGTTSASERSAFAETFRQIQESMLQYANTTYQGKYIFGGCHNDSAPFSGSGSRITYAGTDVTSGQTAALDTLSQEKACVDIGLGLNDGPVSDSNILNTSIPGIAVLGYGVTPDGISKNLIALTGQMSELLKSSEGDWVNGGAQRFKDMMSQYEDSLNQVIDTQSAIGVQSQSLEITASRLNDLDLTYNTQIVDVEYVNDAEAISEYYYAQYTYNAALRVGSSILGPSLLDFLK